MKPNKMKSKTKVQKRAKRGIHVKGKWKAIELDPSLFSEEGMEGLVCFEELKNYRLVDPEKTAVEAAKTLKKKEKKKAQKRKASETQEKEVVEGEESVTAETPKKKAKKKKKKKQAGEETTQTDPLSTEEVTQTNVAADENKVVDEAAKGDTSEESAVSSEQNTQSKPAEKNKKKKEEKKKKKKQMQQVESNAVQEGQPEKESTLDDQTVEKGKASKDQQTRLPKEQVKNWTSAALSGSNDKNTDVSTWKHLFVPAPVLKALSSLGFSAPTPIQALALPPAIRDHMDILGAAETGSGKTLAFGIPMIHTILEWRKNSDKSVDEDTAQPKKVESLYLQDDPTTAETVVSTSSLSNESTSKHDEKEEDDGNTDEDPDKEDDSVDEADEDQTVGCVKVVDNAEFDFDLTGEAEQKVHSQQRPLLGLVLTPTRELAVQVKHHIDAVTKFTDIKTAIVVGGMSQHKQKRMLKHRPEIIIATPGRLWELIKERHPHLQNLRQLRCLVIDEADRMVERGHFAELESLLEMLHTVHFNPTRQMFVFSATLTMVHSLPTRVFQKKRSLDQRSKLEILIEKVGIKSKPKIIDLTRKEATVETLTETQIHCQEEEKDFFLYYFLLQYPGRTMVFANSIACIKRLTSLLVILDRNPLPLHASMHQKQRLKNLERFAERESCVLLTTDVAARGLDIPNVQHVIHYQVPRTSETYVHRSGRTARAAKEGLSLLLIGPEDMMNFKKIYRTLGKDEELPMFPIETKCMEAIKERVNLARKIEKIEFHNSRQKQHNSWFRRAADALEVDLDEDLLMGKARDEETDRQQQRMVKEMKKHLKHFISQPVFKSVMKTKYPTQMGKFPLHQMALPGKESALNRVSTEKQRNKNVPARRKQKKKEQKQ